MRRLALLAGLLALLAGVAVSFVLKRSEAPSGGRSAHRWSAESRAGEREGPPGAFWAERTADRAWPRRRVPSERLQDSARAFQRLQARDMHATNAWEDLGPHGVTVPADLAAGTQEVYGNDRVSGAISDLAVAPRCDRQRCRVWAASAGGIWRTDDALAYAPHWRLLDPAARSPQSFGVLKLTPDGRTLYAGSGRPTNCGDCHIGAGVFRSSDGGDSWEQLPATVDLAGGLAVSSLDIDSSNPRHLLLATTPARAGATAVGAVGEIPPGAPRPGIYESQDAGAHWRALLRTANGDLQGTRAPRQALFDPVDPRIVYASVGTLGLLRHAAKLDRGRWTRIAPRLTLHSAPALAVTKKHHRTRLYLGTDADDRKGRPYSALWRLDDAHRPAAALRWQRLSSGDPRRPGFDSFNYCGEQCWYDNVVVSPPGQPDTVLLGGQGDYEHVAARNNGRMVLRSTDAGRSFSDVSASNRRNEPVLHPDVHAIAVYAGGWFAGTDGGVYRTAGGYRSGRGDCTLQARDLSRRDLPLCQRILRSVPQHLKAITAGMGNIEAHSLAFAGNQLMSGTQDNGTLSWTPTSGWRASAGGDGGQVVALGNGSWMHSFYGPAFETNYTFDDYRSWLWNSDDLVTAEEQGEAFPFYTVLLADPVRPQDVYTGGEWVWRTQTGGGNRDYLEAHCGSAWTPQDHCGDWVRLGARVVPPVAASQGAKNWISELARGRDTGTLWVGERHGGLSLSRNSDARASRVVWQRLRSRSLPSRFVSKIIVDPSNPLHAWIAYSGYSANTPAQPGHVYDVQVDAGSGSVTATDLSADLGDQPILSLARASDGALYAGTDYGVLTLTDGHWQPAGSGLPTVPIEALAFSPQGQLYVATLGRGVWRLPR